MTHTLCDDGHRNLSSDGTRSYSYDIFNRLTGVSAAPSDPGSSALALSYDPAGRLYQSSPSVGSARRFLYDGATLIDEYDSNGNVLNRFVPGPGVDEPVVWYAGAGASDRRWLIQNRMGSVIGAADVCPRTASSAFANGCAA